MGQYYRGHVAGDESKQSAAIRWLRAEYATKTEARQDLGVRNIIDDGSFYDYLKLFAKFTRIAGYAGLLVCLDELVVLSHRLNNKVARNNNCEAILRVLNDCLQGAVEGLGFVFDPVGVVAQAWESVVVIRTLLISLSLTACAFAQITSVDLANYQHTGTFLLPTAASEASAVTFNPDTGNLYVLGDEGDALVEVTRSGVLVSSMTLTGFDDTEGLTYIGGGQFVVLEERDQDAYRLTYTAAGRLTGPACPSHRLATSSATSGWKAFPTNR